MNHIIIINWFNWSGILIWNWVIGRLNWNVWNGNFIITIIYVMMIKFTHDSWNNRVGSGRRRPEFEVSCRRLAVPLSSCFFCFVTMECIEPIHLSPKTWWEELWTTDGACIRFVYNSSTELTNNFLSHAENYNTWLESFCIIVAVRWRAETMRVLTWSGQCGWSSNHL